MFDSAEIARLALARAHEIKKRNRRRMYTAGIIVGVCVVVATITLSVYLIDISRHKSNAPINENPVPLSEGTHKAAIIINVFDPCAQLKYSFNPA